MKVQNLCDIAAEYEPLAKEKAEMKAAHKKRCEELSKKASGDGIAWTELKKLIDARADDAIDGGKRAEKLAKKAEFASAYLDILSDKMNGNAAFRSSDDIGKPISDCRAAPDNDRGNPVHLKSTVSIAAASPHVAERPERSEQASSSEQPAQVLKAAPLLDAGEIPACIERRHELVRHD